jgi:hypothetical protein
MDLDTLIEQVAERVILKMRADALRVREAKLADLRAFEEMHDLPRSIPTRAERSGSPKKTGHHNR